MLLLSCSLAFGGEVFVLIGSENRLSLEGVVPRAKGIVDVMLAPRLSVTTTFVVSPGYAEAYVGPTWSPSQHISLGLAGGMETASASWRVMAYGSANYGKAHLLGIVEDGGSGLWYKAVVKYDVGYVSLGAMVQRFDGVGLRVAVSSWGFELWTAPLYDVESQRPDFLVGLNWTPSTK